MIRSLLLSLLIIVSTSLVAEEEAPAGEAIPLSHGDVPWFKQSFLDIGDDVAEASAAGKRVMIFFHQDGCPYCTRLLQDNFGQRAIAEKSQRYFDVLEINMWGDRDVTTPGGESMSEKDFAAAMKVMYTPTVVFLNEQGKTALRLNGYYYPEKFSAALDYGSGKYGQGVSFREYLQQVAPEKASGKLHDEPWLMRPPYQLSRVSVKAERPLLVLFEQKQCRVCDEWHGDILQREGTKTLIEMFDVVQLDMWSNTPLVTPEGEQITARKWADKLNVQYAPTMIFFDAKGMEVFRSEAYLKDFHVQTVLSYVAFEGYKKYPSFQRFAQARAEQIEAEGGHVEMWK